MITIRIRPSRSIFGRRKQYKFEIVAGNGRRISDRDTYANPGDIQAIMRRLVCMSGDTVELVSLRADGSVAWRERLR